MKIVAGHDTVCFNTSFVFDECQRWELNMLYSIVKLKTLNAKIPNCIYPTFHINLTTYFNLVVIGIDVGAEKEIHTNFT